MAPKKGKASKAGSKASSIVPDSEHVVFTNKPDTKQKKKDIKDEPAPIPRPDARKIIGGASWTGKLPVNLLSEHCQREKWNKPDYSMRQMPGSTTETKIYRSAVTLSKTDPKTKETTTLPAFTLPRTHENLGDQSSALEARHFAATYALFRISSMKSIHMTLPPQFRDLWKGPFAELKKDDIANKRDWKYEADPFAAEVKRQEILASIEKRQRDQTANDSKTASRSHSTERPTSGRGKAFERAPRVELGHVLRTQIEAIICNDSIWNTGGKLLSSKEISETIVDLSKYGFRASHAKEALEFCGTRKEALEWLLIHVPEDDLPAWCLPPGYSAGISLASGDLVTEAKLKRLAKGGYSSDLCAQSLRENGGDERQALQALQFALAPFPKSPTTTNGDNQELLWDDEIAALEAVFETRLSKSGNDCCVLALNIEQAKEVIIKLHKPSQGYPETNVPLIVIESSSLPAYIRLSATKQAITYARSSLLGDQMLFSLFEWLETNLPLIIEDPGRLSEVDITSKSLQLQNLSDPVDQRKSQPRSKMSHRPALRDNRTSAVIRQAWQERQSNEAQIKMLTARQALPAWSKRDEIIEAVSTKNVTLITGDTGSGKSTQAVQFILDREILNGKGATTNILCTQPRRVAALSLSDRVSAERCSREGEEVGYIIRGDSKTSARTKITFMTTGVLLRRLQSETESSKPLSGVSHIVVDEVHERSLDTDFLLALLRDTQAKVPGLKVILMSATVNADTFAEYFGGAYRVARVHIEGRTFPVNDYYLDDVLKMVKYASSTPQGSDSESDDTEIGKRIRNIGMGINYELITALVQYIDQKLGDKPGGILIFLPGTLEIDKCLKFVNGVPNVIGFPLHASLQPSEQKRVFPPAPRGKRKVIAATNVAETSITIEDIVAVIDTGRVKETNYDTSSNVVRLEEVWASKAACKQRRGRAGRVQAGNCYKLFTRAVESAMQPAAVPEMHRVPLEQLCLAVTATTANSDVARFLARTLSPPAAGAVNNALNVLHRMGALENGQLTGLGSCMSLIPADLRCAKLLVYGSIFGCLEACLTIAAILTMRSPFLSPRDKRDEAKAARTAFQTSDGDLLLDLAAFDEWKAMITEDSYRSVAHWCSSNFLSIHRLRDIDSTRRQLLDSLKDVGLVPGSYSANQTHVGQNRSNLLLRALIAGALNPQVARIELPDKKYIASMSGAKELDPEAKTIKYFNEENGRVFVHPSSVMFDAQIFSGGAMFMAYFTKMATSKIFIRELTPFNAYSLLLFGGPIEVDTGGAGILVDGHFRLRGWARIGVLISRLRATLDQKLRDRIENPDEESNLQGILSIVRRLVEFNGQDQ